MSYLPHYQYAPKDFRGDTRHLKPVERDAYREIMDEMWITDQETCSIPDDDRYVAGLLHCSVKQWRSIRAVLITGARPLFHVANGRIVQFRLRAEMEQARIKSDLAVKAVESRSDRKGSEKKSDIRQVKDRVREAKREHYGRSTDVEQTYNERTTGDLLSITNNQNQEEPKAKKEISTSAREAKGPNGNGAKPPVSFPKYAFLADQVLKFDRTAGEMQIVDPEAYAYEFEESIGLPVERWLDIKAYWQSHPP